MQVTPAARSDPPLERRLRVERRHRSLALLWPGLRPTRRKAGRRVEDRLYPNADQHSARLLFVAASIMALCCVDALLTLELLGRGAIEANPLMAALLQSGMGWFSSVKLLLTALGVVVLVACSSMRLWRRIPGELVLYGLLGCYVLLIVYELCLT